MSVKPIDSNTTERLKFERNTRPLSNNDTSELEMKKCAELCAEESVQFRMETEKDLKDLLAKNPPMTLSEWETYEQEEVLSKKERCELYERIAKEIKKHKDNNKRI